MWDGALPTLMGGAWTRGWFAVEIGEGSDFGHQSNCDHGHGEDDASGEECPADSEESDGWADQEIGYRARSIDAQGVEGVDPGEHVLGHSLLHGGAPERPVQGVVEAEERSRHCDRPDWGVEGQQWQHRQPQDRSPDHPGQRLRWMHPG